MTQETLANLVGARRPTTTTTVVRLLTERGLLSRDPERHYVLHGQHPDWQSFTPPTATVAV